MVKQGQRMGMNVFVEKKKNFMFAFNVDDEHTQEVLCWYKRHTRETVYHALFPFFLAYPFSPTRTMTLLLGEGGREGKDGSTLYHVILTSGRSSLGGY